MANTTILRRSLLCAALLLALLAGACAPDSGSSIEKDAGRAAGLPGLPGLAQLDAAQPQGPRQTKLAETSSIPSGDFADASLGINNNPPDLTINASLGRIGYALYQAGPFDSNFSLTSLKLFVSELEDHYFLYLGNWEAQRWEASGGAHTSDYLHSFGDTAPRYLSPAGYLYFAVVSDGGRVVYNHAELTVENRTPLPAPGGLSALASDAQVALSWDAYPDPRADSIDVYFATQIDLSDAQLSQSLDRTATSWSVEGLSNGTLYYFALRARNADGSSPFSASASAIPSSGLPVEFKLAGGLWPRLGGSADGSGTSAVRSGPANLEGFNSVALSAESSGENRTSPVIDALGNVYALSRDGRLLSYTSDLQTLRYSFDTNAYAPEGKSFVCPPQAPCLDSAGNAYFVVGLTGSTVLDGYLFGVTPSGGLKFQHNLGAVRDDNSRPYSSPNIGPGGVLVTAADGLAHPLALNQDGSEAWKNTSLNASMRFSADAAFNPANASFNWPCTYEGFSIGLVQHCISLQQTDGEELPDSDYRDLGTPLNLAGGCVLRDGLFIYPENGQLLLINSTTGLREDTYLLGGIPLVAPSRVAQSDYIVQPVPTDGSESDQSELRGVRLDTDGVSPEISGPFWILPLGNGDVHSRAAVDKDGRIYIADTDGRIWLARFDYTQPPADGSNPVIEDMREPDGENTFYFSSFALGQESIYIVSQQDRLIQIYNPLD